LKFASLEIAKELKRFSTPQGHGLFLHWKNALHYGSLILITYMYPIVSKVKAKVTAEKTYFPIYFLCEIGYVSKLPMHTFFCKKDWKFGSVKKAWNWEKFAHPNSSNFFLKEDFILKGSSICCIKYWCGCIRLLKVQAFLWAYKLLYSRTFIGYCRTRFNAHNRVSFCHGNNK